MHSGTARSRPAKIGSPWGYGPAKKPIQGPNEPGLMTVGTVPIALLARLQKHS